VIGEMAKNMTRATRTRRGIASPPGSVAARNGADVELDAGDSEEVMRAVRRLKASAACLQRSLG
jgi:hypothetical protein